MVIFTCYLQVFSLSSVTMASSSKSTGGQPRDLERQLEGFTLDTLKHYSSPSSLSGAVTRDLERQLEGFGIDTRKNGVPSLPYATMLSSSGGSSSSKSSGGSSPSKSSRGASSSKSTGGSSSSKSSRGSPSSKSSRGASSSKSTGGLSSSGGSSSSKSSGRSSSSKSSGGSPSSGFNRVLNAANGSHVKAVISIGNIISKDSEDATFADIVEMSVEGGRLGSLVAGEQGQKVGAVLGGAVGGIKYIYKKFVAYGKNMEKEGIDEHCSESAESSVSPSLQKAVGDDGKDKEKEGTDEHCSESAESLEEQ